MRRTVAALAVLLAAGLVAALAQADSHSGIAHGVPNANPRAGHPPSVVASGWELHNLAQGSSQLENPTTTFDTFGFLADGAPPHLEATKTEPDENTYLVTTSSRRPDRRPTNTAATSSSRATRTAAGRPTRRGSTSTSPIRPTGSALTPATKRRLGLTSIDGST